MDHALTHRRILARSAALSLVAPLAPIHDPLMILPGHDARGAAEHGQNMDEMIMADDPLAS